MIIQSVPSTHLQTNTHIQTNYSVSQNKQKHSLLDRLMVQASSEQMSRGGNEAPEREFHPSLLSHLSVVGLINPDFYHFLLNKHLSLLD